MSRLAAWKGIWSVRADPEYAIDQAVEATLRQEVGAGGKIIDGMASVLAVKTGFSPEECARSFERLIWRNILKHTYYNPPRPSSYRVTNRSAARRPLYSDGNYFRSPLRRDGKTWGPHLLDAESIPTPEPIKISEKESLALLNEIDAALPPRLFGEPRIEICHDIFADILAGVLPRERLKKAIPGYVARALVSDTHASLDGPITSSPHSRPMLETI